MPKAPDSKSMVAARLPTGRTPTALVWATALGWGAFLGFQHEGLFQFALVALSLAAVILWWERKQRIRSYAEAFVIFAVWFLIVMALAYWPVRLLHHISNEHYGSHVIAAINYHNEEAAIESKSCGIGAVCVMSPAEWSAAYSYDEKALSEARQADISDMNRIHPGFGDHFKNEFIEGLTLIVKHGNDPSKGPEFIKGQILVHRFGDWFEANEDAIRSGK